MGVRAIHMRPPTTISCGLGIIAPNGAVLCQPRVERRERQRAKRNPRKGGMNGTVEVRSYHLHGTLPRPHQAPVDFGLGLPPLFSGAFWLGRRNHDNRYPGFRNVRFTHVAAPWADIGSPRWGCHDPALTNRASASIRHNTISWASWSEVDSPYMHSRPFRDFLSRRALQERYQISNLRQREHVQ